MNQPFYSSPGFGGQGESEEIDGVTYLRATRTPCLVCGHPTGDCVNEHESNEIIQLWGYNTNSSLDANQVFVITEDYWIPFEIAPGINTRILKYKKGKQIPLITARELGLIK